MHVQQGTFSDVAARISTDLSRKSLEPFCEPIPLKELTGIYIAANNKTDFHLLEEIKIYNQQAGPCA